MIDNLAAAGGRGVIMKCAARADHMPNFARDAVHVNGKADPAITNERQSEFFFAHRHDVALGRVTRKC